MNDSGKVWGTGSVGESLKSRGHHCHTREPGMAKQLPVEGKNRVCFGKAYKDTSGLGGPCELWSE